MNLPLLWAHAGRIVGGWEYIWAAYGVAWGGLSLYGLSLWMRRPRKEAAP